MNKYIIKREIPNASEIPSEKLDEIGKGSESVLIEKWEVKENKSNKKLVM